MEDRLKAAFSAVTDLVKQLITLASAIIALSIAFIDDIVPDGTELGLPIYLSWGCFLGAIFFGILALMAIASELGRDRPSSTPPSIWVLPITASSGLQYLSFCGGVLFLIVFAAP